MCVDGKISGLDHIHLVMPPGGEEQALPGKTHPAFGCAALDGLTRGLGEAGHAVRWEGALAPRRRFYGEDPFGNSIEFIEL